MRFLRLWVTLEVRRRWRSLAALALVVAFALAAVLAAVAGSRRGASALERLRAVTLPADVQVLNQDPAFDYGLVRELPGVAASFSWPISRLVVDGAGLFWNSVPLAGSEVWRTIERPVVLDGRLPDPSRADEVVVLPRFAERYGKGVGDRVDILLSTPEEVDLLADSTSLYVSRPTGPVVHARIVGLIRSPYFTDPPGDETILLPSPGLFQRYRANFLGLEHRIFSAGLVRLTDPSPAGVAAFRKVVGAQPWGGRTKLDDLSAGRRHINQLLAYEASALLALALAAFAAAVLMTAQFVARLAGASLADLGTLRASGLTPRLSVAAAALPPVMATAVGAVAGGVGAAVASLWMPVGGAASFEPRPGLDVDWTVLAPGVVAPPLLVALGAAMYALVAAGRTPTVPARSAVTALARRLSLPVPVLTGLRFALERGHGRTVLPVRSALLGAVAGVLGVLAAFTFSTGVSDSVAEPARFGQSHDFLLFVGDNGHGLAPERLLPVLAKVRDVVSADDARVTTAGSAGLTFPVFGMERFGARPLPVTVQTGERPTSPGEIMLGVATAQTLHATVGRSITVNGPLGAQRFTVSGIGFVPQGPANLYTEGALTTSDGYRRLFSSYEIDMALVALRPGADRAGAMERLYAAADAVRGDAPVSFNPFITPAQYWEVQGIRALPIALGGFLALLALATTAHTLATAVRRRQHEIAVLRALGLTKIQARWIVVVQGTALAVVGLAFGVPLGLALGRLLWRRVAEQTPVLFVPPAPTAALLLIAPLALLAANLLGAWPARVAARLRVAQILRAE
ncbi:FtsX-like permease family protein [Streptosporangiaceae bacterium NEAU-GS5]|nr:FtsX-like permease family protein [Streptosporangiaceae bacterium NEAU-GS5]